MLFFILPLNKAIGLTEPLLKTGQSVSLSANCWGPRPSPLVSPGPCHPPHLRTQRNGDSLQDPHSLEEHFPNFTIENQNKPQQLLLCVQP